MTATAKATSGPDHLSLVVFSGAFERVHYALVLAAGALASNRAVTLFFTMGAARALLAPDGWTRLTTETPGASPQSLEAGFAQKGVATFEELLAAAVALGARFMVCEMGLKAMGLDAHLLRADVPIQSGGVVTFLAEASKDGAMLFI
jgi:peroxiredoxin family protein